MRDSCPQLFLWASLAGTLLGVVARNERCLFIIVGSSWHRLWLMMDFHVGTQNNSCDQLQQTKNGVSVKYSSVDVDNVHVEADAHVMSYPAAGQNAKCSSRSAEETVPSIDIASPFRVGDVSNDALLKTSKGTNFVSTKQGLLV